MKALFLAEKLDKDKEIIKQLNSSNTQSFATVFWRRIKSFGVSYTITPTVAVLAEIFLKNFGMSTMLVAYMQYISHKNKIKKFTHKEFCCYVIPWGLPNDEEWERLWKLQKIDPEILNENNLVTDNGLDYPQLYQSLMSKKYNKK